MSTSTAVSVDTLDDVDAYVSKKIEDIKKDKSDAYTDMEKNYRIASLLISIGKNKDSLPYFEAALNELRPERDSFVWGDLYCNAATLYASTLDLVNDVEKANEVFQEVCTYRPDGVHIGDYAVFLHKRKKDNKKAEVLYKHAIELFPDHSSTLLKYAGFLRHIKKDRKMAEIYYKRAVEANPQSSDALGNYASFLHGQTDMMSTCYDLYERAVKCDPTHTNNYCNFGLFLSEEKKQYRQAEEMYRHALKISPKHSNSLYNYAVMLDTHCNRKPEAESLYRGALAVDPRHSYALYNLAVLLEEIAIDRDGENSIQEIAKLYKAATDIDPRDPASAADYGRFILVRFDDFEHAEPHLLRALGMDDENEVALYNLALLYHKYKPQSSSSAEDGNIKVALEMYRRLVAKNSQHLSGLLQLARLLVEVNSTVGKENSTATNAFADGADGFSDASVVVTNSTTSGKVVDSSKVARAWMEEVIELYEAVIPRHKEPDAVVCEFTKVVNKYGSARQKMRAIATAEAYMRSREERSGAGKDKGDSDNEYSEVYSSDISRVMEIMKKSTNK